MKAELIRSGMRTLMLTSQVRVHFHAPTVEFRQESSDKGVCLILGQLPVLSHVMVAAVSQEDTLRSSAAEICDMWYLALFLDISGQSPGSLAISTAQREKRLLNGIIHNLLPAVGPSVTSIVLAYSSTASSKMVRLIPFSHCENALFGHLRPCHSPNVLLL